MKWTPGVAADAGIVVVVRTGILCKAVMSYVWSLLWLMTLAGVSALHFFTDIFRGKKKKERTSGSALHQVLQNYKVFPIHTKTGWELERFCHGIRVWKHEFAALSQKIVIYGCQTVATATPQEILSTLQDVSNTTDWDPYTEYCKLSCEPYPSNAPDSTDATNQQQQLQQQHLLYFDTVSCVPKYNTKIHRLQKFLIKISNYIPGVTVVEHENLSVTIARCWQTELDDSIWMFSECPDTNVHGICWTYVQARPLQDGVGSLLTMVACPDVGESPKSKMIATQLASLRDYFQLNRVKLQPSQEDNIGNKLKAFAGQLKKRAQTFSFKKDQFHLDSADTQAIQNELKATDEQEKAAERAKKSEKEKKTEPRKFGKRLSFDFYKSTPPEKSTSRASEAKDGVRDTDNAGTGNISWFTSSVGSTTSVSSTASEDSQPNGTRHTPEKAKDDHQAKKVNGDGEITKRTLAVKLKDLAKSDAFRKLQDDKMELDDSRHIPNGSSVVRKTSTSSTDESGQSTPTKSGGKSTPVLPSSTEVKFYRTLANQAAAEVLAEALKAASIDVSSTDAEQRRQTGGWQFQCLEKEVVILRKDGTGPYHSFLGKGLIKAPPKAVYEAIKNPLTRFTYDNMLKKLDVVANLGTGLQVLHMIHETTQIFRKDCRDFSVLQTSRIDGDLYIVAMTSVDWPDSQTPEGGVRAIVIPSGWVIEPAFRNRKIQSMVTYMVQIDVGGKDVPASFFNFLSKRLPLSIAYLRQYLQSGLP